MPEAHTTIVVIYKTNDIDKEEQFADFLTAQYHIIISELLLRISIGWFFTKNKYRGGTSDATTPSSLILSLFMMSFDDFWLSKTTIFVVQK